MDEEVNSELATLRLHSQAAVQRMWELLMRPLGFRSRSLWMNLVDDRGAPVPMLMEIADNDEVPTTEEVARLFEVLTQLIAAEDGLESVAFLITRPGCEGLTRFDRELSDRLLTGARDAGIPCHPIHVANDLAVMPVAPDDLAA